MKKNSFDIFKHIGANQNVVDPILFELWIFENKRNLKKIIYNIQKFMTQKVMGLERSGWGQNF